MSKLPNSLVQLTLNQPCSLAWEEMRGNQITRFCDVCQLHVHNFSALTETEALHLVTNTPGRLCVRFDQTADGTILTAGTARQIESTPSRFQRWSSSLLSLALSLAGTLLPAQAATNLGLTQKQKAASAKTCSTAKPKKRKGKRIVQLVGVLSPTVEPRLAPSLVPPFNLPESPKPNIQEELPPPPPPPIKPPGEA